ncbi:GTPase IMAP family member 7-like [Periophthalmus magnuspinnatus]|uniref:GTPase IMAP family member 7-like n=1 Tax=Periophthalmus magnuspinnatus TaxID=409849 RepID=UPI00145B3F75|nr:GTPase IMAP family member 7-like [Periophthalmus magnuspinnatus]
MSEDRDLEEPNSLRIVLLGKHGSGKSSLGEKIFRVSYRSDSKIRSVQTHSRTLKERKVTLIDTPGVVGTQGVGWERAELEGHCEWLSCLVQCAPGPHALLLVMPMFRFTIVIFTHGDQLPENTDILEFVEENTELAKLVQACGGRCHVVDNKYWTKDQQKEDPQRSNEFQVEAILNTVEKMVDENQKYLSNDALEQVEHDIQTEQSRIHTDSGLSLEESREQAKNSLLDRYIDQATRCPPYAKYAAVMTGVAGVALVAILVLPKVMKFFAEKPPLPLPLPLPMVPIEPPALPDLPPAPEMIQEVVQEVVPTVISEFLKSILTPPEDYDPFDQFN